MAGQHGDQPGGCAEAFQHKGGGDFLVVHLAPALLRCIVDDSRSPGRSSFALRHEFCTRDEDMAKLCLAMLDEYRTQDFASGVNAEALANQLAVHLIRRYSSLRTSEPAVTSKLSASALRRAVDYIDANLANDLTIGDIADALSISATHFAHAFKGATGIPPHRYIMTQRIELAKRLLRDTRLPIASVAVQAGFSTHAHFCVLFQRMTGLRPSAYRIGAASTMP